MNDENFIITLENKQRERQNSDNITKEKKTKISPYFVSQAVQSDSLYI